MLSQQRRRSGLTSTPTWTPARPLESRAQIIPNRAREDISRKRYTAAGQLRAVLLQSWVTAVLLPTVPPVAIAINYYNGPSGPILTFALNFVAIIPLGRVLELVTRELTIRRGPHTGIILIVSFSNGVQFIQTIIAVIHRQSAIVQRSLIGAVVINTLLVPGAGFLIGGWQYHTQNFNAVAVAMPLDILVLSFAAILIPTAINLFVSGRDDVDRNNYILKTSHALSILLIISYLCHLFFSLKSHYELFTEPQKKGLRRVTLKKGYASRTMATIGALLSASGGGVMAQRSQYQEPDEEDLPSLSVQGLVITLCIAVGLLGVCTSFMVDSVDGLTQKTLLSESFVGIILLPLLSCNLHAITLAKQDKLQQSLGLTVHNNVQILLFILPLAVMIGWIRADSSMTLNFDGMQVVGLGMSLLTLKAITQKGASHWLDGVVLLALFAIVALNAWFTPESALRP